MAPTLEGWGLYKKQDGLHQGAVYIKVPQGLSDRVDLTQTSNDLKQPCGPHATTDAHGYDNVLDASAFAF